MHLVLLRDVILDNVAEVLVEVRESLQQLLVGLFDACQHIA